MKRYLYALVIVLALSAQPTPPAPPAESLPRPSPTWHRDVDPEGIPRRFAFESFADHLGNCGANGGTVGDPSHYKVHRFPVRADMANEQDAEFPWLPRRPSTGQGR